MSQKWLWILGQLINYNPICELNILKPRTPHLIYTYIKNSERFYISKLLFNDLWTDSLKVAATSVYSAWCLAICGIQDWTALVFKGVLGLGPPKSAGAVSSSMCWDLQLYCIKSLKKLTGILEFCCGWSFLSSSIIGFLIKIGFLSLHHDIWLLFLCAGMWFFQMECMNQWFLRIIFCGYCKKLFMIIL